MNHQMTSPMMPNTSNTNDTTITCPTDLSIDQWLIENSATSELKNDTLEREKANDDNSHYENCLALQKQLCLKNNNKSIIFENEDNDDDYATQSASSDDQQAEESRSEEDENHSNEEESNSIIDVRDYDDTLKLEACNENYDNVVVNLKNERKVKKKEVLLKVVVVEHEQSMPGNDDVFYINPSVSFLKSFYVVLKCTSLFS